MGDPFIGEIRMVAFKNIPSGWVLCNGQTLSVYSNNALFSLLGTTYGGDGVTNFKIPNLNNNICKGSDVNSIGQNTNINIPDNFYTQPSQYITFSLSDPNIITN
jgi:microcystin-dependent protein